MLKQDQIYQEIKEFCNLDELREQGIYPIVGVKELFTRGYRAVGLGRYQINVRVPGERRDRIFRTKKDGSYNILDINDVVQLIVRKSKAEAAMLQAREANRDMAKAVREKLQESLGKSTFVSAYGGSANTFVTPSSTEGLVMMQIAFGSITPEKAQKIADFVATLEA